MELIFLTANRVLLDISSKISILLVTFKHFLSLKNIYISLFSLSRCHYFTTGSNFSTKTPLSKTLYRISLTGSLFSLTRCHYFIKISWLDLIWLYDTPRNFFSKECRFKECHNKECHSKECRFQGIFIFIINH